MKIIKKKKLTVTIGIPAFNEEANIGQLISSLLSQAQISFKLKEIAVFTDGSTDQTSQIVRSFKNPKVKLFVGQKRLGQQRRQNQIIKYFNSDILIIIEADLLPADQLTIENLIQPFSNKKIKDLAMVVGNPSAVPPKTFFEKVLFYGYNLKKEIFVKWKNGENIYTSGGHAMKALSGDFARSLKWPDDVPEDAYVYLKLCERNLEMRRQSNSKTYMRNVTHFNDRIRQCTKFMAGRNALLNYFPVEFIRAEYTLPKTLIIKTILLNLFKNHFWIIAALLEMVVNRIVTLRKKQFSPFLPIYQSSKNLST